MKSRVFLGAAGVGLVLVAVSGRAAAEEGFAANRFEPTERGSDWFYSESLDLRGGARPAFGTVFDYARQPLVFRQGGVTQNALVSDQMIMHLGGAITLGDRVRIGANVPVAFQAGDTTDIGHGDSLSAPTNTSLGDVRLTVDTRVFGAYGDPFTFALGARAWLPTGSQSAYVSDGTVRIEPRAMVAGRYDWFEYAVSAGIAYRPHNIMIDDSQLGTEALFSASVGARVFSGRLLIGPELMGETVVNSSAGPFTATNSPIELLGGAHYSVTPSIRTGVGIGAGLSHGLGTPAYRGTAMLEWAPRFEDSLPPPPDRDDDHIADNLDACPEVAGVATTNPKTNGCPADRDGDMIVDGIDACPFVRGVASQDPMLNGCPAATAIVVVEQSPPPAPVALADQDGDGIPDAEDACPMVRGMKTSDPKTNGCPSDRDGDTIADGDDACPQDAGPRDVDPKRNGCPKVAIRGEQLKLMDPIKFRVGKAELDPASDPVLDGVLGALTAHVEIQKMRIEGHTDTKGSIQSNVSLSRARAEAVRKWLIAHGIEATRLTAEGFGPRRPVAANDTEEGRRENRRVEFHIISDPNAQAVASH